ncbi:MAG: hypothetical protein ABSC88_04500 [Terracidiphilus sp.]
MSNQMVLWRSQLPRRIPPNASTPEKILSFANSHQLVARDCSQIISAYKNEHYEMLSSFIWTKALTSLKAQLGKLGTPFISEMLDRPDIDGSLSIDQVLTDFEALRLAKELGVITGTGALRLRQALERLTHFGQMLEEDDAQMTADEAVGVVRACVENILGQERIEAALDFKEFRDALEDQLFTADDEHVQTLLASPYFFQRASVRILLAIIKSRRSAQLENSLANANLIIPLLWKRLLGPEKVQIGRAYAEVTADGKSTAAAGIRKVLLKVHGFDYVPEDLRSKSFVKAANALLAAHEGANNFYNEPGPARHLEEMGSVMPIPAFPVCMAAALSVRLGNRWNICFAAQPAVDALLKRVSLDRWRYYFNDCIKMDDRILSKLLEERPRDRWIGLLRELDLGQIVEEVDDTTVRQVIQSAIENKPERVTAAAKRLLDRSGFTSE